MRVFVKKRRRLSLEAQEGFLILVINANADAACTLLPSKVPAMVQNQTSICGL